MTVKEIEKLQQIHSRMTTALNELAVLEDGRDADYSDVIIDYKWIVVMLENRRESLQKRGRRL